MRIIVSSRNVLNGFVLKMLRGAPMALTSEGILSTVANLKNARHLLSDNWNKNWNL